MMLADKLRELLGTMFAFYVKAEHFHWNVEGQDFLEYHKLFGMIYEDAQETVDPIAEYVRTLDEFVVGGLKRFSDLSIVDDQTKIPKLELMVKELLSDNDKIIEMLKDIFDVATKDRQHGIANFIADRLDKHGKWHWFLTASLK